MFTGIVRHVGVVRRIGASAEPKRMTIDLGPLTEGLKPGDSVAVSGSCLTAVGIRETEADFDVIAETISKTTLGMLRVGSKVNIERPLTLRDALDGHIVQGHVDGTAEVRSIKRDATWEVEFSAPGELVDQMVPKGSVAIDGVSLTLTKVGERSFAVALIPTTLAQTTLENLTVASRVNVETDIIGKYVLKHLQQLTGQRPGGGLSLETLKRAGFG